MQELVQEFLTQKIFAVVGATNNLQKYGHHTYQTLKSHGYEVYPLNPNLKELGGDKCYSSLAEIPVKVDVVYFVVSSEITEKTLNQCRELGLNRIWIQPGSEDKTAMISCHENNMKVVHGFLRDIKLR